MDAGRDELAKAAARLAAQLPPQVLELAVRAIEKASSSGEPCRAEVARSIGHPHYRSLVTEFLDCWNRSWPGLSPEAVGLAVQTAALVEANHQEEQTVELVWTGPTAGAVPFRRTEQAILQVLNSTQRRLTLVSYPVYRIPRICEALIQAAQRNVKIQVIVETAEEGESKGEFDALRALGSEVASCSTVYCWPRDRRVNNEAGRAGVLHPKCVVADGRWLFVSSANLTEHAFTVNMELGVLITGGRAPRDVERHFDELVGAGVLREV
jgi:phosphatidylserine/phosphatidylglycerophosphate/cardiolipin synthase-like enzyme